MPSADDDHSFVDKKIQTPGKSGPFIPTPSPTQPRTGPLTDQVTLEVVYEGNVVGYVFSCPSSIAGVTQEQRWILSKGFCPLPRKGASLRWATGPAKSITTLSAWRAAVPGLWGDGATYVMVSVASYPSLGAHPAPPYLFDAGPSQQVDDGMPDVHGVGTTSLGDKATGYVFGTMIVACERGSTNGEHWVQLSTYASPASAKDLAVILGEDSSTGRLTQDEFLRFVQGAWSAGATYSITSCVYLDKLPTKP